MDITFGSICSGIEAASEAWIPLGLQPAFLSEIEAFPKAVLAARQNSADMRAKNAALQGVPLWGDFTAIRMRHLRRYSIRLPDILIGGTPCQAFSIAGLRGSLSDDRGNLTLAYVRLANAIDNARRAEGKQPIVVGWENVPGVLSTKDNAFGCFLAALVGADAPLLPPKRLKWTNAGMVVGPRRRAAWIIKDAQYFGLAQRRERVFVVASALEGFDPSSVLFEPEGLRRHSPPRRGEEAGVTGSIGTRVDRGGAGSEARGNGLIFGTTGNGEYAERPATLRATGGDAGGGSEQLDARCLNAHGGPHGRLDFESETLVVGALCSNGKAAGSATQQDAETGYLIAHTLRAEGFDASEDGTGRGIPLVPTAYRTSGNWGAYDTGDKVDALTTGTDPNSHLIAFSCKDHGADATSDLSPTMRAMGHADSHPNAGGQLAIAFMPARTLSSDGGIDERFAERDLCDALHTNSGNGNKAPAIVQIGVRRLLPLECARLQGFADDYLDITYRGKPAADGPKYKALGNSMAVPVIRWLGKRILSEMERTP